MNRYADLGFRKYAEECIVRAADTIVAIDGGDGADHSFQHLGAEPSFAPRGLGAVPGLTKAPLHLPNGRHGNQQTGQHRKQIPGPDRTGRGLFPRLAQIENLLLFGV